MMRQSGLCRVCLVPVAAAMFLVVPAREVLGADDPTTKAAEWVQRFASVPPRVEVGGVCPRGGEALPSFVVTPAASGRQLVRVSLPFAPGTCPADLGLDVRAGSVGITPDVQILTYHPGRPKSVRRAIVTFVHEFADKRPVTFTTVPAAPREFAMPTSRPGSFQADIGGLVLRLSPGGVEVTRDGSPFWRAEFLAPQRSWTVEPTAEVIAQGANYLWVRLLVPDERWPRILELRADALGTVAVRGHLQRLEPTSDVVARAPDIGWRISGPAASALRAGDAEKPATENGIEHAFKDGIPASILAGDQRVSFPDAHLLRRGSVAVRNQAGRAEIAYRRCRQDEQVPHQLAAWRTATAVLGPTAIAAWTTMLEPAHDVRIAAGAFDVVYGIPRPADLSPWPLLSAVQRFHIDAIAASTPVGDDFGNVTQMPNSGVYGMNRLNHCPPMFEAYYRTGDARLRTAALHWCENYHDLSIWWGTTDATRFGGTRYNNIAAHGERPADPNFMWRSNTSVSFCTKGIDAFFYAYEETGDPRMATALRWQVDYAAQEVRADKGECRNIGDVMDWVRLYRFTGDRLYRDAGLNLFRQLRTKLSEGDLFSQGGQPIVKDSPFIDDDKAGTKAPFAKPYIIGYALSGLPALASHFPDEPKLRDVIRAVADFQARAQDPTGGWRYPHPSSSRVILSQAVEHAMQLSRAAAFLERRGEPIDNLLDAIERTLRARILGWQKSGQFLGGLTGWEEAAGLLKDGKTIYGLYKKAADRDPSRDYTEGQASFGGAPPDGVVYFFEALEFYLAHRPAERLFHAGDALQKVLDRVPVAKSAWRGPEPAKDYLPYGVEAQLPTFRESLLRRLSFPMAWDSASSMSFADWRGQARAKVLECLLVPPPRADFAPVVIAREDRGTYEARKLVLNVSADCRIPAYLLVPKGKGPFPAIVALHDHGAFFVIGKEKLVRPFGVPPEVSEAATQWCGQLYGGRFVGDALAERGYVVFCADALFWGERGRKEGVDYTQQQALAANLLQMGMTWLGVNTWDDIRAAEFVASLPEVDPRRIGAVGLSMGCHRTWMLHAVSDRIAAAVGVCWMGTTETLMAPGNNQAKGHSAYSILSPDLRNFLDYPDVASIACPKPLMLFDGGEKDTLFPVAGIDAAYSRMHKVWESQGVADRLVTKRWDVGHVFNVPMQDEAFAWLDRWLK